MTTLTTDLERAQLPRWALDRLARQRETIEALRGALADLERLRSAVRALRDSDCLIEALAAVYALLPEETNAQH